MKNPAPIRAAVPPITIKTIAKKLLLAPKTLEVLNTKYFFALNLLKE